MAERRVKCPECGKPSLYSPENAYRPFCSERCRLIDLGQWIEGKHSIPSALIPNADSATDGSILPTSLTEEDVEGEIATRISHSSLQTEENE